MRRQTRRNLNRPVVYPIPEELREEYARSRVNLFRRQFSLVVNVIFGAMILYQGLALLLPVALPLLPLPWLAVIVVFEIAVWRFVSQTSRLGPVRLLVLVAFAAPLLLFLRFETDVAYFVILVFVLGLLAPWNGQEAALAALFPLAFFIGSRRPGGFETDEPFVILLALGIVALTQFRQEWDRRARFVLEHETAEARRRIEDSIDAAAFLHEELISRRLDAAGLKIRVLYEPMQRLGGDFIKFAPIGEDRVALLLADVTGHGVPAALMVNRINTRVEALMKESLPPLAASRELAAFVADVFDGTGILMSAIWAEFHAHGREVSWVGFGHPPALRVTPGGLVEDLPSMTHLLGIHDPMPVPVELSCHLAPGDLVVFYTDGLIEAPTEANPFRLAELKTCLAAVMAAHGGVLGAEAAIEEIARRLKDCRSEEALDDLLIVAVEISG